MKPYWGDFVEGQGLELNTIASGQAVYNKYLEQYGSKRKALLKFKGAKRSAKVKKIIDKIIKLESKYKVRVRQLMKEIKENEQKRGY